MLLELIRRRQKKPTLRHPDFIAQNEAIDDESRFRAWNCTRRAAKSTSAAIDILESLEANPGKKFLFCALTIGSAREIIWDILKNGAETLRIPVTVNEARSTIQHQNGARVSLFGLDASEKQMRKVLGQAYKKVFIDEAGSYTVNLEKIVKQMLRPALIDHLGQLTLLGTCENIPNTYFEKVTKGLDTDIRWSVKKWSAKQNPFVAERFETEIKEILEANPDVVKSSWFRTHYLNEWCSDDSLLVYNYSSERNGLTSFTPSERSFFALGVDLGFNDSTSFTVYCVDPSYKRPVVIESFKKPGLILSEVANLTRQLKDKYDLTKFIIDGANKQGVEEMRIRHGIPWESAEKQDKHTFMKMLADDFMTGSIAFIEDSCQDLIQETKHLQWLDSKKDKEDPRAENHCLDGLLYAWRYFRHYFDFKEKPVDKNSDEFAKLYEKQLQEELRKKQQEEAEWIELSLESF